MKSNKNFWILIIVGFLLRILYFVYCSYNSESTASFLAYPDSAGYWIIAQDFLKEGIVALHPFRTPFYPLFLAFFNYFFSNPIYYIICFQIVINVFTAYLLGVLAKRIFAIESTSIVAIMVLDPFQIVYSSTILTETLFVFFVVAGVYFLLVLLQQQQQQLYLALLTGVFFSFSALTRPNAFYVFLVLVSILVVRFLYLKNFKNVGLIGVVVLVFFIGISPWLYKNKTNYGYLEMSSITGFNLYFHNVLNTQKDMGYSEQASRTILEAKVKENKLDTITAAFNYSSELKKLAVQFIIKHPFQFIYSHIKGIGEIMLSPNPVKNIVLQLFSIPLHKVGEKSVSEIIITTIFVLVALMLYSLASIGVLDKKLLRTTEMVVVIAVIVLFIGSTGALEGATRYRMPAMPFIYVLSYLGIKKIKTRINLKNK